VIITDGLNRISVDCFWKNGTVTPKGKSCEMLQAFQEWANNLPPPKPPKSVILARKFVRDAQMGHEENLACEFKEIKGYNPARSVEDEVDKYFVAYLNADITGYVYFGVRNQDQSIVGVKLDSSQRDELKRKAVSKISQIEPAITPDDYEINLCPVYESESNIDPIPDLFLIQFTIRRVRNREIAYYCGSTGKPLFLKTESGLQKYEVGPPPI